VNEIAPRVHNSAHYSLDGLDRDQFQLHLEALLNRDLKDPRPLAPGFAMVNLLGSGPQAPKWKELSEGQMHWYGKKDNRAGRKMGHVNVLAAQPAKALKIALNCLKEIQL
jgi:5-(carboxyamino)imidazole ribonucleotide synthase